MTPGESLDDEYWRAWSVTALGSRGVTSREWEEAG